jgi:hypothetical protein
MIKLYGDIAFNKLYVLCNFLNQIWVFDFIFLRKSSQVSIRQYHQIIHKLNDRAL